MKRETSLKPIGRTPSKTPVPRKPPPQTHIIRISASKPGPLKAPLNTKLQSSPIPEVFKLMGIKTAKADYIVQLEGDKGEPGGEETKRDYFRPRKPIVRSSQGPISLRNMGNTCFANAAFNGLHSLDIIYHFFLSQSFEARPLADTIKRLFEKNKHIRELFEPLRVKLGNFFDFRQHCAHSFLLHVLSTLDKELPSPSSGQVTTGTEYTMRLEKYRVGKCAELHDALSVMTENLFICKECNNLSFRNYSYSRTLDLPVPKRYADTRNGFSFGPGNFYLSESYKKYRSSIDLNAYLQYFSHQDIAASNRLQQRDINVTTCFAYMLRATLMSPENCLPCSNCNGETQHYKQSFLRHISPILILHFQLLDELTSDKLQTRIKFDLNRLDMSEYLEGAGVYDLKAVVYHMGSLYFGHYTATVRIGERWYSCNDEVVTRVSGPQTEDAYLLFYEKASCRE
jgi:hypothetical protein